MRAKETEISEPPLMAREGLYVYSCADLTKVNSLKKFW